MNKNRIKQLRETNDIKATELAKMISVSKSHLSRLERGETGLSIELAQKIAMALNVNASEIMGIDTPGLSEDAAPYKFHDNDYLRGLDAKPNHALFKVKSNALSKLNINAGDVVVIDMSEDVVRNVEPLKPVVAQVYEPGSLSAVTVIRQFIPPDILLTNSQEKNERNIYLDSEDVQIKGVIVGWHRDLSDITKGRINT